MKKSALLLIAFIIVFFSKVQGQSSLLTNLEEYYKLDELSGQAINSAGNYNNGSVNATQGAGGKINYCYSFDSPSEMVTFDPSSKYIFYSSSNLSISAWILLTDTPNDNYINIWGHQSGPTFFLKYVSSENKYFLGYFASVTEALNGTSKTVELDQWHHVAMVKTGTTIEFYLDGNSIGTKTGYSYESPSPSPNVYIGSDPSNEAITGNIDELGIWSKALTSTEIGYLYGPTHQGLTYPFIIPSSPSAPTSGSLTNNSFIASWNTVTYASSYRLDVSTSSAFTSGMLLSDVAVSGTSYNVTGLNPATVYYFRVRSKNDVGTSASSTASSVTTTSTTTTVNAPSNLSFNVVSCSQINLTWTDNSTNESNFTVERKTGSGGTYAVISSTIAANSTSYSNTGLSASTTYYYRVKATNEAVSSSYCTEVSATTSACSTTSSNWESSSGSIYYNGGKVGIGTSTPAAKLDLLTDHTSQIPIRITHNNYNDWVLMKRRTDNSQQFGIKEENGEGCLGLATAGTTRMIIDQFGYVGIGITNPKGPGLSVGGSDATAFISPGGDNTHLSFASTGELGAIRFYTKGGVSGSRASTLSMVIDPNGRVGIGTDNPMANLDIRGTSINIKDPYMTQRFSLQASDAQVKFELPLNRSGIRVNTYFIWADQGGIDDPILFLNKSGNVGIGCHNPAAKLTVNGGIRATRIDITQTVPCSDFVFNSDYKLMNLADLDAFIKANKHLPEVPSAKEFEENGYSVGDMDNLLLKKVEELTLYVIELKKQQELLMKENKDLKDAINSLK